jgi:hypothetical protein
MADSGTSPVFVLSASRSGSTLMRFILDSHPDLACPPESDVTTACSRLMHSWNILENATTGGQDSADALAAVRDTVDDIYGRYLERRGKRRWCHKALGPLHEAELMHRLYPEARFICLYRHCMDVIASGVEACPWGLHRFGFDNFAAQHAGNSVAAVGSYWLATARTIMAFEQAHPDVCHRVRYEDLVTAPEEAAAAIFSFLGEEPVPDIARACLRAPHEGNGPGDEKIWFTSAITADSVGGGVRVPVAALVPEVRHGVNEVLSRLGYLTIDDEWNALVGRVDMRADAASPVRAGSSRAGSSREADAAIRAIGDRLRSRSSAELAEACAVWSAVAGQTIAIVAESSDGDHAELRWGFPEPSDRPVCTIIASPATWHALLNGETNLVSDLTAGRLRCVNRRDGHRIRSDEVHAIGWLLGLAPVPLVRSC